jgi:saccharopine dehydrogenase (NAD+, L-lysine forming)
MHLWIRSEVRNFEKRVGITPNAVLELISKGFEITVEDSNSRAVPIKEYKNAGANIVPSNSWPSAPDHAIIFGLKELPENVEALKHRHIMFGHAYKDQSGAPALLKRFKDGGGTLYDLEYLLEKNGSRIAAFGYWAGFAGAAVSLKVWLHQQSNKSPGPKKINIYSGRDELIQDLVNEFTDKNINNHNKPNIIVIGGLGRVGKGAIELAKSLNIKVTVWDVDETRHGGPFPEILDHNIFINCILARPGVPIFVPHSALNSQRRLSVVSDISCDPDSPYNPIPIYDAATSFAQPVVRITEKPSKLDVTAIDNLPSMLPVESSEDFSAQILPTLLELKNINQGSWAASHKIYLKHI